MTGNGLRVSIVVPAKNEARNLSIMLPLLPEVHEIIVVDGNSVDGSLAAAAAARPDAILLQQTRRGKGNALACGFAASTGDVIVMFDADGSADPGEIPKFLEALSDGADVAKGSRFTAGGGSDDISTIRLIGNAMLNVLTNLVLGTRYSDLCYGYNAFRASALRVVHLPDPARPYDGSMLWGDGFEIETLLTCQFTRAGLNIVEVPSHELPRIHGASNLNAIRDGIRVLRTVLNERRRAAVVPATRRLPHADPAFAASGRWDGDR